MHTCDQTKVHKCAALFFLFCLMLLKVPLFRCICVYFGFLSFCLTFFDGSGSTEAKLWRSSHHAHPRFAPWLLRTSMWIYQSLYLYCLSVSFFAKLVLFYSCFIWKKFLISLFFAFPPASRSCMHRWSWYERDFCSKEDFAELLRVSFALRELHYFA